jgi:hypothetical protein
VSRQVIWEAQSIDQLDLDYQHEIIRRVHQERDQAPAVRAEMQ